MTEVGSWKLEAKAFLEGFSTTFKVCKEECKDKACLVSTVKG